MSADRRVLRIGLTQRVDVVAGYGERRDCLDQAWTPLLASLGMLAVPLPNWADADELLDVLELDGVILSGGNDLAHLPGARTPSPERDRLERALIDACGRREVALLGVCRGMQMLVAHHGGELTPVEDHVGSPHSLRLSAAGTEALPLAPHEEVNSYHDWGIPDGGEGSELVALAFAPDTTVEAVVHRQLPQWGIMWHPERAPKLPGDGAILRAVFAGDEA